MSDAEYVALKADIQANGQLEDIWLLDGKILDGRHRYRACTELKVEPRTRQFKGKGSPLSFVCSKAIHRNLDKTQKACAAARIEPELAKEAEQRMKAGGKVNGEGLARDHAARIFGISGTYVGMAKTILAADPKLFQQCFDGQETLSRASATVRRAHKKANHARLAAARPHLADDRWEIRCADCLRELEQNPFRRPCVDLAISDPPYNEGLDYGDGGKSDALPPEKYVEFTRRWISGCAEQLAPAGALAIIINAEWAAEHAIAAKGAGLHLRNWCIWYETFGVNCPGKFNRCARHVLIFTKSRTRFTFNADAVTVPSARQTKYADKRAVAGGKVMDDVWTDVPRLVGSAKERIPEFPTQLPEKLVDRLVLALSNPGDQVLDPFSGSGTTVAVCRRLGRRALGIEKNPRYVELSRLRVSAIPAPTKEAAGK